MTTGTASSAPAAATGSSPGSTLVRRLIETPEVGVVVACVVVFVALAVDKSSFAGAVNLQGMGFDLSQYGLIAIGESLVILTGGIDLSVGALLGTSVIVMSWLNVHGHLPGPVAVLVTLVLTGLVGLLHGLAVTRLKMAPFVVTLVTYTVAQGITLAITSGTSIVGISPFFGDVGQSYLAQIPVPLILFAIVAVCAWFFLERTYAGRQVYAVGGNAEAARRAGINVGGIRLAVFAISGTMAALGGIILASRLNSVDTSTGGGSILLYSIAAAVIGGTSLFGGRGAVRSALLGAIVIAMIDNGLGLLNVSAGTKFIVTGIVLLAAVTLDSLSRRRSAAAGRV
jgi:ribose transport system permease protein